MAILEIKNLRVDYQTDDALVHALNDVNLKMEKGKTLGLVGETGAGKTTLAKCIMGILPQRTGRIRSGEIFYEDKDLLKTEEHEMRKIRGSEIAMIFQDPMTLSLIHISSKPIPFASSRIHSYSVLHS